MTGPNRRSAAAIAYDQLCTFEFGVVTEVFGLPRPELGPDWYDLMVCSHDQGPLSATGGISVNVDRDLDGLGEADTVIVPGWRDPSEKPPDALLVAIEEAYHRGSRIVSICSGVFVLAAAGLLSGRRATTHWRYVEQLARDFPDIDIQHNVLYVEDGDVFTSAGSSAGIDLCIHLVRLDYGADVAAQVARRLVVPPHREGGQAQYVPNPLRPTDTTPSLSVVMDWALDHIEDPLTVADLADQALMAPRTFARWFGSETGTTPHHWLTQQRLHLSQQLLETTSESIDWIAQATGFRTAETLRHHFRRAYNTTPTGYRTRFASSSR